MPREKNTCKTNDEDKFHEEMGEVVFPFEIRLYYNIFHS